MKRKKYADELSEEELRIRLMQKKSAGREARIASYRASGRVVDERNAPINTELRWNPESKTNEVTVIAAPRRKLDFVLLLIEIAALIGVIYLIVTGANLLRDLNQKSSRAMILPTLTPTALIHAIVLPGGHTPPDADGVGTFNESEIPAHLRGLFSSTAVQAPKVPDHLEQIVRIRIPSIEVDAPVVFGDDWESLKLGVGMNTASSAAGQKGNVILSGHNDIFGEVFRDLDKLNPGDEIIVLTEKNAYTYSVQDSTVVMPNQVEVMAQTTDATVTLISCYPYLVDDKRIVITGKLL